LVSDARVKHATTTTRRTPPTYSPKITGGQDMNIIKVKHYQQPKAGYMVVITQKEKKTMLYIVLAVIVLATLWAMGIEVYL